MSKSYRKDLTGQRFGRLTVIEFVPTEDKSAYWKCRCDCGKEKIINRDSLTYGRTQSCGCWSKEVTSKIKGKHYLSKTRLYNIWLNMRQRCRNPNNSNYKNYGGRGITVCCEWKDDFQAFYDWAISNGYNDNLSIDRIDGRGNYEPSNCRWADRTIQSRNRKNTITVEYQGEQMLLIKAAKKSKIEYDVLMCRYQRGDRGERLFRPVRKQK